MDTGLDLGISGVNGEKITGADAAYSFIVNGIGNILFGAVGYGGKEPPKPTKSVDPIDDIIASIPKTDIGSTTIDDIGRAAGINPDYMGLSPQELVDKFTAGLKDSTAPGARSYVKTFDQDGDYYSAVKMFEEITGQKLPQDVIDSGKIYRTLPDGTVIGIRKYSSEGSPTFEFQIKDGEQTQYRKIRFK